MNSTTSGCGSDSDKKSDIEDLIIPPLRDFVPDPETVETLEKVIYEMIKTPIASEEQMKKFLTKQQKTAHMVLSPMKVLYIYKTMITLGKITRHKEYEPFLISKKVRGTSGVMVVTVATSPWPNSVETEYISQANNEEYIASSSTFSSNTSSNTPSNTSLSGSLSGDVIATSVKKARESKEVLKKRASLLEKTETTVTLAKKNKHFSCKYDCFYCPSEPGQPRSYLLKEPGIARANQHRFDPIAQFRDRGNSYLTNGHVFDKIELIVLGGTWSSYPSDYQESFIRDLYFAANTYYSNQENLRDKKSVDEEIKLNETSNCRIIGLTLETRPDEVKTQELIRFRRFGVTRVQIGVQHTNNDILKYINRGCTIEQAMNAILLLKANCFKVDIHLMPDLPGSNPDLDFEMFKTVLNDPMLQADQWKIYPCAVVPWTKIEIWHNLFKEGYDHKLNPRGLSTVDNRSYAPYADIALENIRIKIGKTRTIPSSPLIELLLTVQGMIHPWIRVNRIIRDIPGLYITGGNDREDLRAVLDKEIENRGLPPCKCIRSREVRDTVVTEIPELVIREYEASHGKELFISFEINNKKTILAFLRLRLPYPKSSEKIVFPELQGSALMRELHVYGIVVPVTSSSTVSANNSSVNQHIGYGKLLIKEAERLAIVHGFNKIAVIAGVGVRNYYRKLGYHDCFDQSSLGNFQIKTLGSRKEEGKEQGKEEGKEESLEHTFINYYMYDIFVLIVCIILPFLMIYLHKFMHKYDQ
jgi:histone acetyltransferase (RNA polymerase elongator complex component)